MPRGIPKAGFKMPNNTTWVVGGTPLSGSKIRPFASGITSSSPACTMCTWCYRWTDHQFHLKYKNAWCPDHV